MMKMEQYLPEKELSDLLKVDEWSSLLGAYRQADAAVDAAHISADAAIRAAWIQGGMALFAGFFALLAGVLAYKGAKYAAERQVKLIEDNHQSRVDAYAIKLSYDMNNLLHDVQKALHEDRQKLLSDRDKYLAIDDLPTFTIEPFSQEHWELHLILGKDVFSSIGSLRVDISDINAFREYVSAKKLKIGSNVDISDIPHKFSYMHQTEKGSVSAIDGKFLKDLDRSSSLVSEALNNHPSVRREIDEILKKAAEFNGK